MQQFLTYVAIPGKRLRERPERIRIHGTPRNECGHKWKVTPCRKGKSPIRILRYKRFHAKPDHLGDVVIGGVFLPSKQTLCNSPPGFMGHALQGGSQILAHHRSRVHPRHMGKLLQSGFTGILILHKHLNSPCTHIFVLVPERFQQAFLVKQPGHMQGPHASQAIVRICVRIKLCAKSRLRFRIARSLRGAVLQNDSRTARMPVACTRLQICQLHIGHGSEIVVPALPVLRERSFGSDTKDSARILVQHVVATDVAIMPIQYIQCSLGTHFHAETDPLCIVGHHEVFAVARHISRSLGSQDVG